MNKLSYEDIFFKPKLDRDVIEGKSSISIRDKIYKTLDIKSRGFNIFLIDKYNLYNRTEIIDIVEDYYKDKEPPKDICYVVLDKEKQPYGLKLKNGYGIKFKEYFRKIKSNLEQLIIDFFESDKIKEKNNIIEEYKEKKDKLIDELVNLCYEEGFEFRFNDNGFSFIPIVDGKSMKEEEFNNIEGEEKSRILNKVDELKFISEETIENIANMDEEEQEKLLELITNLINEYKDSIIQENKETFIDEENCSEYLDKVITIIIDDIFKSEVLIENDKQKLKDILDKYKINVIVDNKDNLTPRVYFEDDPTISNLFGTFEVENISGSYVTNVSLLKAGSLLKCDGGCIIIKISEMMNHPQAYHYIKNFLYDGKINYKITSNLDYVTLNGFYPEHIESSAKVIFIGDYSTFDLLYNLDEDFKNLFKVKIFNDKRIEITDSYRIVEAIDKICSNNNITIENNNIYDLIIKALMRKSGDKDSVELDYEFIEYIILICENNNLLKYDAVYNYIYREDNIEIEYLKEYKKKDIFIKVTGRSVGEINGLSVLSGGDFSFGKPLKITCVCSKGTGNIIDSHKESTLSGKIHSKSLAILRGLIIQYLGEYFDIPVDFYLSFEQLYSKLEGDSASVAEFLVMISALTKLPIRQNIAVTGSLNQLGTVQPIGGVNEKIEGFFKVRSIIDTYKGKGVLIPYNNIENLVLKEEVEEAIRKGEFSIYIMKNIDDAIETMFCDENISKEDVLMAISKEIIKYIK